MGGPEKKGLGRNAETCFENCATALKKIFSEAVGFPKSMQQGNCFVKKNMVRKKNVLAEKLRPALETVQQPSKKYFLKQSDFPSLCNRATASSKKIWSEKKRSRKKAENCFGDCATALKKIFSEAV